jgi:hypothetical protein
VVHQSLEVTATGIRGNAETHVLILVYLGYCSGFPSLHAGAGKFIWWWRWWTGNIVG